MKGVLSIGTTHPWNIAGVGLDLHVGAQLGTRVFTVTSATSAQDAQGLHALEPVAVKTVEAQLAAIPWECVAAVRVGALGSSAAATAVVETLAQRGTPAVIDPVIATSTGGRLNDDAVVRLLAERFLALSSAVVTPNLTEAGVLLGTSVDRDSMVEDARRLQARGARAVLLKGGHGDGAEAVDLLLTVQGAPQWFSSPRLEARCRGTGCALASAIAAGLASGQSVEDACRNGKQYVLSMLTARAF